jgi:hypothetical protein
MYVELEAGATGETAGSASVGRADAGLEPRTSSLRGMELVALEGTFAFALELNLPRHLPNVASARRRIGEDGLIMRWS